ncbi:hypothetical protein [Bartonella sp. ML70XJBT.G]|uniref:hypothetical protein n=1 Tax=Bartonella sp. ML70XJBT.G TaxID=3019093 RepID=UPI00236183AD|nr:hypothetical protein [Bartonella sp. ML70XJBT.G]
MNNNHYTYRVFWSPENEEYVCLCAEFPSLSWLDVQAEKALKGIMDLVSEVVEDINIIENKSLYLWHVANEVEIVDYH